MGIEMGVDRVAGCVLVKKLTSWEVGALRTNFMKSDVMVQYISTYPPA